MKKTLVLMALAAGVAFADAAKTADMKADMAYLRAAHGSDAQDFSLSYTVDAISGWTVMELGNVGTDAYKIVSQQNKYIGLQLGSTDTGTSNSTYSGGVLQPNGEAQVVHGWISRNASTGSSQELAANSHGAKLTISSDGDAGTSSIKLVDSGKNMNNTAQNTVALNFGDLKVNSLSVSDYSVTVNGLTQEESRVSGQHLTTTIGGSGYMAETVFNFAVMSDDDAVNGAVIAAYGNQNEGHYNYFTLTESEGLVYFTASMGTKDADGYHVYQGAAERTVTLNDAAIEIGREYTAVIVAESSKQYVYLYDDQAQLLATGSYNGNMNGNLNDSGALFTYENETYAAPEPATATLSLLALAGLMARRRRH